MVHAKLRNRSIAAIKSSNEPSEKSWRRSRWRRVFSRRRYRFWLDRLIKL